MSGGWEYWSTTLLGFKTMRGTKYSPCEEECIQNAIWRCTEENWNRGGKSTFKMFGRWPMKRVGVIEEIASAFFCFLYPFINWLCYRYYSEKTKNVSNKDYGYVHLWKLSFVMWSITFSCAALFHVKDTVLTERMDYFSAFIVLTYVTWCTAVRLLWLRSPVHKLAVAFPLVSYCVYHLWYMQFVSFDYGYNMTICIILGIVNSISWLVWAAKTRHDYIHYSLKMQVVSVVMVAFEAFDFPPVFGYFDAHSIWHAFNIVLSFMNTQFLVADALHFEDKRTKKAS